MAAKAVSDINKSLAYKGLVSLASNETHRCGSPRLWSFLFSGHLSRNNKQIE